MFFDVGAEALQEGFPVGLLASIMLRIVLELTQDLTGCFLIHGFGRRLLSALVSSCTPIATFGQIPVCCDRKRSWTSSQHRSIFRPQESCVS